MLVFALTCVVAGVMFFVAPGTCDSFNQYGCFQTYYSGTYKVAGVSLHAKNGGRLTAAFPIAEKYLRHAWYEAGVVNKFCLFPTEDSKTKN